MPQNCEPIEHEKYYHIYNRGINGEILFREPENYKHFLRLYEKYIDPVAETFAWCLLRNHFHLLVRIKEEDEIASSRPDRFMRNEETVASSNPARVPNPGRVRQHLPSKAFSNLFNAYTQAFNKRFNRHGSLFEKPFRRIRITHDKYFKNMVYYIHNNPVKHGFVDDMVEYPWSSYLSIISVKPTKLQREAVLGWFNSKNNFRIFHQKERKEKEIEKFIME
jgi:REP element-mobilizing transposase RayT